MAVESGSYGSGSQTPGNRSYMNSGSYAMSGSYTPDGSYTLSGSYTGSEMFTLRDSSETGYAVPKH